MTEIRCPVLPRPRRPAVAPSCASIFAGSLAAAVLFAHGVPASAQMLSDQDCREGSDFIRNAALSRDNGIAHRDFAERLEGDIGLVMRMPIEVRWFVYTDAEAGLLRRQVDGVFASPQSPEAHQTEFLASCHQLRAELALRMARDSAGLPLR